MKASDAAKQIAGPKARIKRHGLFNPVYEVTTEPSLLNTAYHTISEFTWRETFLTGLALSPLSVGANTAIAEEAKNHFPFPQKLSAEVETEYKPVSGSDYSHFGFKLTEIDKDGKPIFGDFFRVFSDILPDGTTRKNAGVRVPFDFGCQGKLTLYGLDHSKDEGMGARLSGSYGDWLLGGVLERAEFGGDSQGLKGLGIGRMFHSNLGKTTLELWGYDKIGERFGNIFLFQDFSEGYSGGLSFTGGHDKERDFSASFGRFKDKRSWRFHGGTALNGEGFSLGGSFILDPDPRFATLPFGYLNTENGVKSYQTLWRNAMGYYPYQKLFEKGRFVLHADYFHNEGSERLLNQVSVRPFYFRGSDSELLKGIHIDGAYDWSRSGARGHDNRFTGGLGIRLRNGLDFHIKKTEGESPVFFVQFISLPFSTGY